MSHLASTALARCLLSASLLGCGAAQVAPPPAPLWPCTLTGIAEDLPMAVDGLPDALSVDSLPAEVSLTPSGRPRARVLRPLRFEGLTEVASVRAHLSAPLEGRLTVVRGAAVRRLTLTERAIEATVVLAGASHAEQDRWTGVALRTTVRCDELGLGAPVQDPVFHPGMVGATHWIVGDQDLVLLDGPGGTPLGVLTISAEPSEASRGVQVLATAGSLAHVRADLEYGSIDAWIESARLGPPPPEPELGNVFGYGCGSGCGRSEHPYSYRGPAMVRAGTEVTAEATGRVWALVVEDITTEVGIRASGAVEIISVPGLRSEHCGNLEFDLAMVPSSAVVLPTAP